MKSRDDSRRNRTGKSVTMTISMPSNMLNNIDAICANTGEKRSSVVQAMIQAGFAHKKIVDAEKEWTYSEKLAYSKALYLEALGQHTLNGPQRTRKKKNE